MKIVIFGLTISSSWGNGHATIWRGLCRALIAAGHDVVFFERNLPYYAEHRDFERLNGGQIRIYREWLEVLPEAQSAVNDAEVAIITSYCPDALAAAELVFSSGTFAVFYDLDTPVTLHRLNAGQEVAYLGPRGLADYDLVLSYTGGEALEQLRSKLGARVVAPLYGCADPNQHKPVPADPALSCDLSYLGTYAEDRQGALEALFVKPAVQLPQRRFLIGGAQYPTVFPWANNIFFIHHVEPGRHPAFFCSSKITLNITRGAMRAMGYCPSGRLFEAIACGAPVITDIWEGLDHFFEPGTEILTATTTGDVIDALQRSDADLKQMANRARERVLAEHTAAHRAREFESALEGALASRTTSPASTQLSRNF